MPKRAPPGWKRAFLRALGRTGNVRAAAAAAGVDPGTAYDHRHKDAGFAGRWEEALAKAKVRPLHQPSPKATAGPPPRGKLGEDLVLRRTVHGDKWVRVAAERWSAKVETAFLAELRRTGNVRAAARAIGMSTTALYNRRKYYPDFAARWAAAEAEASERVPALLDAATIASLDPEIEPEGLPPVSVDQAIAICRMKGWGARPALGAAQGGSALRYGPPEPSIEQVRANILARLEAIEAHERRAKSSSEGA